MPLSFPNLYIHNFSKKILFYGESSIGKFTYSQAILNNIIKLDHDYDILIIENKILTFNDNSIESISNILSFDIKKLIILVHSIEDNFEIVRNYYHKLELKNPIWLVTSKNTDIDDIFIFDLKIYCEPLNKSKIKWYLKSFISDYLINDNSYYLIYNNFQQKIFSKQDINNLQELSILYSERYKYILNYNIPLKIQEDMLDEISEILYNGKYNLYDLKKIVKNSIYTLSQYSIKNNIYYLEGINYISSLSHTNNSDKDSLYYIEAPSYDFIMVNTVTKKLIKYTNMSLLNNNFTIEDELIYDIYISENLDMIYKVKMKYIDVYFKTELKKTDYKQFYFSYYCTKDYLEIPNIDRYNKFLRVLKYKIKNKKSLLFEILKYTRSIGFSVNNNNIHFHSIHGCLLYTSPSPRD